MADSDNKQTNEDGGEAPETDETVEETEASTDPSTTDPSTTDENTGGDEPAEAAQAAGDAGEPPEDHEHPGDGGSGNGSAPEAQPDEPEGPVVGVAAFFDHPDALMSAARHTRDSDYERFDAYSPFPIHGMDDAMGLGRSWIPWVTFFAGLTGFILANAMQFGMMTFDWPMIVGGKPYAPWPSFVPIMFELTVLLGGVTTAIVALAAGGCFRRPFIIDPEITNDRFALWISADDATFEQAEVVEYMESLRPVEIRTVTESS